MGGDEFALIARNADRTAAMHIAGRLVKLLNEPLSSMERTLSVGISIGIAAFPEDGRTADDLYKRADIAMYRAKAAGGGYRFYQPEMSAGLDTRIKLARSLARAIDGQELQLYYQPQLDLSTGAVIGAEALLRWHDAEHGWVSPAEFIPIAEERGMMGVLGTWVIQAACDQMKSWRQAGLHLTGRLAFNLSAQQLEDADIARKILSIVEAAGLTPAEFENRVDGERVDEECRRIDPDHGVSQERRLHVRTGRFWQRLLVIDVSPASAGRPAQDRYFVCARIARGQPPTHDRNPSSSAWRMRSASRRWPKGWRHRDRWRRCANWGVLKSRATTSDVR